MRLPESDILTTTCMGSVFRNTTATYKFYWFIALLDSFVKEGKTKFSIWDLSVKMVANAWFPVTYFRLSFGKVESLYQAIWQIQERYNIPINISKSDLIAELKKMIYLPEMRQILRFLQYNVPYRFLSPWIKTADNREMAIRSQNYENNCLYSISWLGDEMYIELNPQWLSYLSKNYEVLKDFSYWNLTLFLQVTNPNVPNISAKLIKIESRRSLQRQRNYWDFVISKASSLKCIYTDKLISIDNYDLDHFMPWSFVSHDLLWNLLPADSSINSVKSNKLPSLDSYLHGLVGLHQTALQQHLSEGSRSLILEDYLALGSTPYELASMDFECIYNRFYNMFSPINQIAENMGFERWAI